MEMNRAAMLLMAVVFISGCLSAAASFSPYCARLTKDLQEEGKDCECRGLDETPADVSEKDVTPKCTCTCTINGTTQTFNLVQSR